MNELKYTEDDEIETKGNYTIVFPIGFKFGIFQHNEIFNLTHVDSRIDDYYRPKM